MALRLLLPLLLVVVASIASFGPAPARAQDPGLLVIRAGDGTGGFAVNAYLPATITIAEGTTVRWEFEWYEPHTITFGAPPGSPIVSTPSPATYDGTGFLTSDMTFGPGPAYDITFTAAGNYPYYCLVHPAHKGTVVVTGPSDPAIDTQSSVDARGDAEFDTALAELQAIAAEVAAQPVETHPLPGGATERIVRIARESQYGDVQQYFPPALTIQQGDTVTWRTVARTPHTVTFGPFPSGSPQPGNPLVDGVFRPGPTYEGEGYWNSGVLGIDQPAGPEFSMTFSKTGSFDYYCILHANQGHRGTIEVVAAPVAMATPRPPASGTGPAAGGDGQTAALALASLAGVLALGATVFVFLARR